MLARPVESDMSTDMSPDGELPIPPSVRSPCARATARRRGWRGHSGPSAGLLFSGRLPVRPEDVETITGRHPRSYRLWEAGHADRFTAAGDRVSNAVDSIRPSAAVTMS